MCEGDTVCEGFVPELYHLSTKCLLAVVKWGYERSEPLSEMDAVTCSVRPVCAERRHVCSVPMEHKGLCWLGAGLQVRWSLERGDGGLTPCAYCWQLALLIGPAGLRLPLGDTLV